MWSAFVGAILFAEGVCFMSFLVCRNLRWNRNPREKYIVLQRERNCLFQCCADLICASKYVQAVFFLNPGLSSVSLNCNRGASPLVHYVCALCMLVQLGGGGVIVPELLSCRQDAAAYIIVFVRKENKQTKYFGVVFVLLFSHSTRP